MYILGYSGLDEALNHKKRVFKDLEPQEYRMIQGLNSAAALIKDGQIIAAAEEERFIGIKHTEKFPFNAIQFCLSRANINPSDLDFICHGFDYSPYAAFFQKHPQGSDYFSLVLSKQAQINLFKNFYPDLELEIEKKFVSVPHHAAHAASAYYPSGFDEALILVADALGEIHSISLYHGHNDKLISLHHDYVLSSLGMLYTIVTYHLGFSINSGEGKVMGLSSYGDPTRFENFFSECVELAPKGQIFIKGFYKNTTALDRETYRGFRSWLTEKTIPPRSSEGPILQEHKDLAASLQKITSQALYHLLSYWQQQTGLKKLAGGLALNCNANGHVLSSGLFDDIYVQPAAGDDGTALGAALYHYKQTLDQPSRTQIRPMPFFGPDLDVESYLATVNHNNLKTLKYEKMDQDALLDHAVEMLATGKIIAWANGNMEFGPRALGHRSILADPSRLEMRDKINKIVKKRESFRPFAPSVKKEKAHIYFEISENQSLPYMLFIVSVREEYRQQLPAITHVDGTARVQTVDKEEEPLYWRLLDKFEQKTGLPMLLNTSFNIRGQPIVCSAKDAIETFLNTDIDALFISGYLFVKLKEQVHEYSITVA